MNNSDQRGPWYLLTGVVLGVVFGLVYAWAVQPVRYTDTAPVSLRKDFKDHYRGLIAAAYLGNPDLVRARARLALLQDEDMYRALTEQAQRTLAENGSDQQARALGVLAIALGQAPPSSVQEAALPAEQHGVEPPLPPTITSATPAVSLPPTQISVPVTATPTEVEPPTATAVIVETATTQPAAALDPNGLFVLLSQEKVCDPPLDEPLFQVEALDRFNTPASGVLVVVAWDGGEERFYTGLKPEKGLGYADFTPQQGILYSIRLGETGAPVGNLAAVMCPQSDGAPTWGAWMLRFVQP